MEVKNEVMEFFRMDGEKGEKVGSDVHSSFPFMNTQTSSLRPHRGDIMIYLIEKVACML